MHVVWDWNGTLLADMPVVIEAVNAGIGPYRSQPVTLEEYRTHYTRPVKRFYDTLLDRTIDHAEWLEIDRRFHDAYEMMIDRLELAGDALDALKLVDHSGHTQSLLSMYPHEALLPLVSNHGVGGYFARVDGLRGSAGDRKAEYLRDHMTAMQVSALDVLVVGDTPDDASAARSVGARCVLVDGGGHHREELEGSGVPVASALLSALQLGLGV